MNPVPSGSGGNNAYYVTGWGSQAGGLNPGGYTEPYFGILAYKAGDFGFGGTFSMLCFDGITRQYITGNTGAISQNCLASVTAYPMMVFQ